MRIIKLKYYERKRIKKTCNGIVNQLFDLAEVPVEKRQAINDKSDEYVTEQLRLCVVSQQRELLFAYEKFLNSELENATIKFMEDGIKRFLANYSG